MKILNEGAGFGKQLRKNKPQVPKHGEWKNRNQKDVVQPYMRKGKKVSFGNDTLAVIKGKGTVQLKEKVKAGNVLYVDGLKHNLLSVSQMCDQGTEVIFQSNGCSVHDIDTGKIVIKGIRTPNNLYIFKEGKHQCYLSRNDEH